MGDGLVESAAHWPAPLFILVVSFLVFVSTAGFPVPITATLLIAGALTTEVPNGLALFTALTISLTIATTARDVVVLWLGQFGLGRIWRWLFSSSDASEKPSEESFSEEGSPTVRRRQILLPRHRTPSPDRRAARRAQIDAAIALLQKRRILVLCLTRLTVIASPLDLAAGILGIPLNIFIAGVAPGRLIYTILLLGGGVISGKALQQGANIGQIAGIVSLILIILVIIPAMVSQRVLANAHLAKE